MIKIDIDDSDIIEGFRQAASEVPKTIADRARFDSPRHISDLQQHIQLVVYNAYTPEEYTRNYNLLKTVSAEVEMKNKNTIDFVLFNDTSKLEKPVRALGYSEPEVVPIQIEEGKYPSWWKGFTSPRPAYETYLEILSGTIETETTEAIDPVIKKIFGN